MRFCKFLIFFFFFNDTATTEIYTLSLHDALPILLRDASGKLFFKLNSRILIAWSGLQISCATPAASVPRDASRSEEHTSELQSRQYLVCRLLLEKKKKNEYSLCNGT